MNPTHRIIRNLPQLKKFIDWLPDLKPNERYFLCLQARKKYFPTLKSSDKTQLKRFVSTKQMLLAKIRQLECPVGCYRTKEGIDIPDEALVLYITLNPHDMEKATQMAAKALIDLMAKQVNAKKDNDFNPHSEVLSCIHKSKGNTSYVHFDIDDDTNSDGAYEIYRKASDIVGEKAVSIICTRGGCHLMIDPKKVISETKNWYPFITGSINCDQTGDLMVPVVGCNQGGFVPYFLPSAWYMNQKLQNSIT